MLASERIAIAAHLHVLLRRKTGRVTDTEWMAANPEYAAEIIRFARARAQEDGHPDLAEWADRLDRAMASAEVPRRQPVLQATVRAPAPAPVQRREDAPQGGEGGASPPDGAERNSDFADSVFGNSGFLDSAFGRPGRERGTAPKEEVPRYVGGLR